MQYGGSSGFELHQLLPCRFDASSGATVSNSGLNAPIGDMARFAAFLLRVSALAGGERDGPSKCSEHDAVVLSRASLCELWTPVALVSSLSCDDARVVALEGGSGWSGMGFFIERQPALIALSSSEAAAPGAIRPLRLDACAAAVQAHSHDCVVGHSGEQNGFTCQLYLSPSRGRGLLIANNTSALPHEDARGLQSGDGKSANFCICQYVFQHVWGTACA